MTVSHHSFRFTANNTSDIVRTYPTRGLVQIEVVARALGALGFDVASPESMASSLRRYVSQGGELDELM